MTVFFTLSILRPCSERRLYLAIVTGGSVFSSALSSIFVIHQQHILVSGSFRVHLTVEYLNPKFKAVDKVYFNDGHAAG